MRTILAIVGLAFVTMWVIATFSGTVNWYFYYGPERVTCTKG